MKVLILAGGYATRLWPLSEEQAKPLLKAAGKPLISHIVEKIPDNLPVIVSTNKRFKEDFEDWAAKHPEKKIRIFIEDSQDENQKLGAVGAINKVIEEENIKDHLLVIAGDNLFDFEISDFIKSYKEKPMVVAYDIRDREAAKKFGVLKAKDGKLVSFIEKPENPDSTLVSTLCYILPPSVFPAIKEFTKEKRDNAGEFITYLLGKNKGIDIYDFKGDWFDIGSFEDYLKAHKAKQKEPIYHENVKFEGDVNLKGAVFIAENCQIKNSLIEDSVILENTKIENCQIRNCVIGENCSVKNIDLDYKALRNGESLDGGL